MEIIKIKEHFDSKLLKNSRLMFGAEQTARRQTRKPENSFST
jgi:hypothetical protein